MDKIRVKIEIPKGSRVKYEINPETGAVEVDRILHFEFPYNYGYIPETWWLDGDALDAIVLGHFSLHPGVEADVIPIAVVKMHDNGESDYKVVCAFHPVKFEDYREMVVGFLKAYKPGVEIMGCTDDPAAVKAIIQEARSMYGEDC